MQNPYIVPDDYMYSQWAPHQEHPFTFHESYNRQVILPVVNPAEFITSSRRVLLLLQDAQSLSQSLLQTDFATKIMDAAQQSKTQLIKDIIATLPIQSAVEVSYTPHSATITFTPIEQGNSPTASVTLNLVWKRFI